MKKTLILFLFFMGIACQNEVKKDPEQDAGILPIKGLGTDRQLEEPQRKDPVLVLETNALQLLNEETGSTTDLLFGMELDQVVEIINTTIESKFVDTQLDLTCGEVPLTMASWENGLILAFQENKISKNWEFAGWIMEGKPGTSNTLTTISGIGIGSSLEELKEVYETEVKKTSNGNEFSTTNGLYGTLTGDGKDAEIKMLWSGISCNQE